MGASETNYILSWIGPENGNLVQRNLGQFGHRYVGIWKIDNFIGLASKAGACLDE